MEVSARRNCGYPGISPEECASRKCCFSDTIPQVPWCFYPLPVQGNVTAGRMRVVSWGRWSRGEGSCLGPGLDLLPKCPLRQL